jgi:hypothetical protein
LQAENNCIFFLYNPSGLGIFMAMKMNNQLRQYLAAIGQRGGKAVSDAKAEAARENGKRGGRPRKTKLPNKQ